MLLRFFRRYSASHILCVGYNLTQISNIILYNDSWLPIFSVFSLSSGGGIKIMSQKISEHWLLKYKKKSFTQSLQTNDIFQRGCSLNGFSHNVYSFVLFSPFVRLDLLRLHTH